MSAFPLMRDMHDLKRATSDALVAQYKVGYAAGVRDMRLQRSALVTALCFGAFVGGMVFAVFGAEMVVRWLA